jgi:DNA polymerase type B, organellar and viral
MASASVVNITPLATTKTHPFALLFPAYRSLTVHTMAGEVTAKGPRRVAALLAKLHKHRHTCYVTGGITKLRYSTGATAWKATTWRGKVVRMTHTESGCQVVSLRGCLEGKENPLTALARGLEWLHGYGVAPSSPSGMAFNLWRATLPADVSIDFDPTIGRSALFGGRQQVREARTYHHQMAADITSAYPSAMASHPYALSLRAVSPATDLDPTEAGLATATVWVDSDMTYAPLPVRLAPEVIQWQTGTVHGTWSWSELAAARSLGCRVDVKKCWAPSRTHDLFGPWEKLANEGRQLPGAARVFAKMLTNSLWGCFAMSGDNRGELHWTDDGGEHPVHIGLPERNLPHARTAHVAAETAARVRVRMLLEGLYGAGGSPPIHVDTDGIIVRKRAQLPVPNGDQPGQWRLKTSMAKVEIKAPQVYRYTCGQGCGVTHTQWHYVTAGVPASMAADVFDRTSAMGLPVNAHAGDLVLPQGNSAETERNQSMARMVSG